MDDNDLRLECLRLAQQATAPDIMPADKIVDRAREYADFVFGTTASVLNLLSKAEEQAAATGLTVDDFCHRARVSRSTWQRWKAGMVKPTGRSLQRVIWALNKLHEAA